MYLTMPRLIAAAVSDPDRHRRRRSGSPVFRIVERW